MAGPHSTPVPSEPKAPATKASFNLAVVVGEVSSEPVHRELPSGGVVLSLSVRVRSDTHATTSVPVLLYDPPPGAAGLVIGTEVLAVGRVARRFFHAGGATQSRTELVAERVEPTRRKATCRKALRRAEELFEAVVLESFI